MAVQPPVLVVYFNRPEVLERTLRALAEFRPAEVYLASDGPRTTHQDDALLIARCHNTVRRIVTWDCTIRTLHADRNHGCDVWVPAAITWLFQQVDRGIILEDDCIISEEYYKFAAEMLETYRDDPRVMSISAANFHRRRWGDGDYFMSRYPLCWGWATWRAAWAEYDPVLRRLDELLKGDLERILPTREERRFWTRFFRRLRGGRHTFWDAKWVYSMWLADGVSISPNYNLVSNIGYGSEATHTTYKVEGMEAAIAPMPFPLHPPASEGVVAEADTHLFRTRFRPTIFGRMAALWQRIGRRLA